MAIQLIVLGTYYFKFRFPFFTLSFIIIPPSPLTVVFSPLCLNFINYRMGVGGKAIPPYIDKIENIRSDAEFILLVEKEAAYMRMAVRKRPTIVLINPWEVLKKCDWTETIDSLVILRLICNLSTNLPYFIIWILYNNNKIIVTNRRTVFIINILVLWLLPKDNPMLVSLSHTALQIRLIIWILWNNLME